MEIYKSNDKPLVGKTAYLKSNIEFYPNEWGTIIDYNKEDDEYFIAIANGTNSVPCFSRKDFTIRR